MHPTLSTFPERLLAFCRRRWRTLLKAALAIALFLYSDPLAAIRAALTMTAPQVAFFAIGTLTLLIIGVLPILRDRKKEASK